jgi:choline kinase
MSAIILAAGQGTRLRPLTNDRPKCLVPLVGRPLIERQCAVLKAGGISDIVVVGGYCADMLSAAGYDVLVNPAFESTNMVATLFAARDRFPKDEDLFICYGDIVYENRVLDAVAAQSGAVVVAVDRAWRRYWELRMDDPLTDAETLKTSADGHWLELGRAPSSYADIEGQYIGLIKIAAENVAAFLEAYDCLDRKATYENKDFNNMYMTSFIQSLIDRDWDVRAADIENGWLEVDTTEDLALYERLQHEGELTKICSLA